MTANSEIVILYADLLHFEKSEKEGGGMIDGVSVSYLYGHDMIPVVHPDGSLGQRAAKAFLSPECWGCFGPVPAIYNGTFDVVVDSKGKPTFKLVDVLFSQLFHLTLVPPPALADPAPPVAEDPSTKTEPVPPVTEEPPVKAGAAKGGVKA